MGDICVLRCFSDFLFWNLYLQKVRNMALDDVVILNVDTNTLKTTRKLLAYLTTQTPHTLRTRRSEILAEVVWWPVTFYLIQCGVGTGQETYMAPSILLRLASSSFLIRNGFLPAEVWMQCSQEPP